MAIFWSLSNVKTMRKIAPKFCDLLRKLKLYLRIDFVNPRVSNGRIRGRTALASSVASMATPAARVKCHLAWDLTTFSPLFHIICQFLFFDTFAHLLYPKEFAVTSSAKNWSSKSRQIEASQRDLGA